MSPPEASGSLNNLQKNRFFKAVTNVRGWWSEEIEGRTDKPGAQFKFHYKDLHRTLDLKFTREELKVFNHETISMHPFPVHSRARFQVAEDCQLKRIEPPSWLNHEDIQNAPVE
jgi:hypothetical protein